MKMIRVLMLLVLLLMPVRAQAAITIDFGAIIGTIQSVVTNVKVKIDRVKANVLSWKMVQALGSAIKSVSEFFQSLKEEYIKQKAKFDKWRDDITRFISDAEAFYVSALHVYEQALDTAEYLAEIGARFQAYFEEGSSIIKDSGDTVKLCGSNLVELVSVGKHIVEQWDELKQNYRIYKSRKEELEQQLHDLEAHNESNAVTNEIRNLRDKLQNHLAQIDNIKQGIRSIKNQFYNHIAEQKNLIYTCKYNIMLIKARIKRLTCNMTIGEFSGFEDRVQSLGSSVNMWNDKLERLQVDAGNLDNDISGCVKYCSDCDFGNPMIGDDDGEERDEACKKCAECKPVKAEAVIQVHNLSHGHVQCERLLEQLFHKPDGYTCAEYKKLCNDKTACDEADDRSKCLEAQAVSCQVSCSSMCGTLAGNSDKCCQVAHEECSKGHSGYCENYRNNCGTYDSNQSAAQCKSLKDACDKAREEEVENTNIPICDTYRTLCSGRQQSFNYSISHSSPIAYADIDLNNISNVKSGTDENGVFLLPNNLAICCDLNSDSVLQEGALRDCIARYNDVMKRNTYSYAPSDPQSKVSDADKKFFQCIRKKLGTEEFDDKVKQSDKEAASKIIENALAEYFAAGYLEAMEAYNDSFYFKNNKIDPVVNTKNKDAQSAWDIAIDLNLKISDRLNAISNLWAREQLTRSFVDVKNYRMSKSFLDSCQEPNECKPDNNKGK